MVRLGVVTLLLAFGVSACSSAGGEHTDDEYEVLVEACDLVDPETVAALVGSLAESAERPRDEPSPVRTNRVEATTCRHEFGDSDSVPITRFDEFAPDTPGTPAGRYVSITAMRHHAVDGRSGAEHARHWLKSDPQTRIPDLAALGLDDGDIAQHPQGVESFTRIRAIDANLKLLIEYGGANIGARPAGMPEGEGRDGALRLLADAAARCKCPTLDC